MPGQMLTYLRQNQVRSNYTTLNFYRQFLKLSSSGFLKIPRY